MFNFWLKVSKNNKSIKFEKLFKLHWINAIVIFQVAVTTWPNDEI